MMRKEHHAITQALEAKFMAKLHEQQQVAEHAAAEARESAAFELRKSEAISEKVSHHWAFTMKTWRDGQAAIQDKALWDHKNFMNSVSEQNRQ
eukprot:6896485-Heterocapsa_arctica.AAC.1